MAGKWLNEGTFDYMASDYKISVEIKQSSLKTIS